MNEEKFRLLRDFVLELWSNGVDNGLICQTKKDTENWDKLYDK